MTTPTIASVPLPVPPTAAQPTAVQPGGKDADTGEQPGQGGTSGAEEFASMVAGLVAALLSAPNSCGAARPSEAAEGRGAQQKMDVPAGAPILGRVAAPSEAPDGAETRPQMQVPAPTTPASPASPAAPASPASPDSGGAPGPSAPADAPATQPESKPGLRVQAHGEPPTPGEVATLAHTRNLGRDSALSEGPDRANTQPKLDALAAAEAGRATGAAHAGHEVGPGHSGREVGSSRVADAPAAQPESPQLGLPAVAPPSAPAAPSSAAPVDATAPPPAATAAQLVEPVASVHRRGPDGTHTITVEITPEALGPVRVEIELRDGTVELRLAGHSEAARDALRAALPELRRALEAAGVGTGSFQVTPDAGGQPPNPNGQSTLPQFGQPQHGGHPQNGHARPAWAGPDGRAPQQPDPEPAPVAAPDRALDLQL